MSNTIVDVVKVILLMSFLPVECLWEVLEVELAVEVAAAVEGLEAVPGLLGGDAQDGRDGELRDEARAQVDVRQRHDGLVARGVDRNLHHGMEKNGFLILLAAAWSGGFIV